MKKQNLIQTDKVVWLVFKSQKTGTVTQLPLGYLFQGKAIRILYHYPDIEEFFHIKPNASVNKELIRIRKLAGITKHFSFHLARHIAYSYILKIKSLQDLFFRQVMV